ncbi:MAG: FAD/FMN-containing dehydrogenase/Fe-S oxidoreductase [Myxococcota bacterium]|jgi:FAD/FMN-containing dehydrogenase/Fe-S oxidoreductase
MIPRLTELEPVARAYTDFLKALADAGFAGEIAPDYATRLISATDNSVYQLLPQAVVFPRDHQDVVRVAQLAAEPRFSAITLSPRGGGTGTNGQSLTDGLVVDLSRHMNRILELDLKAGHVVVEPGVVLDQLNAHLAPHGVFFAPTLSPSNRATIGGMIGTDACGKGSRIYGRTSEHVLELETVLIDGTVWTSRTLDAEGLEQAKQVPGAAGRAHRVIDEAVVTHADEIRDTFPRLQRFMTGYNLARVKRDGIFDLNALLCGSEGTLGLTTRATLKLTPIPAHRRLVVLKYGSFEDALESAEELVQSNPGAIETIDETVLALARKDVIWHAVGPLLGDAEATRCINLVEYEGNDARVVEASARALLTHERAIGCVIAETDAQAEALWTLRKKGVGLLANKPGARKPVAFVEDTVVPPERLREYIREFRAVLDAEGLYYGMFGHIDVGCLHVRPALDMTDPEDAKRLRRVSDKVARIVQSYGGVIWGEHGKGLRSEYNPQFFGEVLYGDLCRIKAALDPLNQLNPGKLAVPEGFDAELKTIDSVSRGEFDRQIPLPVREAFDRTTACNGNGACFHWDADHVMCPSYKVTRQRTHSPKGRAGVMREWLRQAAKAGVDPLVELKRPRSLLDWPARIWNTLKRSGSYDYSQEVFDVMDGCFACKACDTQCPVRVNVPEFRSRFLTLYHRRYVRPLRDFLVAGLERLLPLMAVAPRLINAVNGSAPGRALLGRGIGIVDTPALSHPRAPRLLADRAVLRFDRARFDALSADERARTVLVLPDAFTTFYEAPVLAATCDVLGALGYRVDVLPYVPSGKGQHIKGFRSAFERNVRRQVEQLREWATTGAPIVGIDPAVTLFWREEVCEVVPEAQLGFRVQLLQEWLASQSLKPAFPDGGRYTLFGHCTERTAVPGSGALWKTVFAALGLELEVQSVGCCGMCGVFGHEARHLEESRSAFELSWQPRLPAEGERDGVLATGHSCRSQVKRFAGFRPQHPVEALAALLASAPVQGPK